MTSEQILLTIIGTVFLALQLVYLMISKNTTKEVITAINLGISGFSAHIAESTEIHTILEGLAKAHNVHDSDGRPIWYMPKSVLDTQAELTKIMHMVASTQRSLSKIMEASRNKIDSHSEECRDRSNGIKELLNTINGKIKE